MKRWSLFAGWLLVLVLVTALTWQIVSAADDRVSDRPIAPLNVAAPVLSDPGPSGSTAPDLSAPPETPTSDTPPSETTATAPDDWVSRSVETRGGTALLRYREGEVLYQSATPAPGYQVEVDEEGPPEVEIEFESEEDKVEIHAVWAEGDLEVVISGHEEDERE